MLELNQDWFDLLYDEFEREYFIELMEFLDAEIDIRKNEIYPKRPEMFDNLNAVAFEDVRVVIVTDSFPYPASKAWTDQGVLFVNTILTEDIDNPESHKDQGWEVFTDEILEILNYKKSKLVFLLWGKEAEEKGSFLDRSRHLVREVNLASPVGTYWAFEECNKYLKEPVEWTL